MTPPGLRAPDKYDTNSPFKPLVLSVNPNRRFYPSCRGDKAYLLFCDYLDRTDTAKHYLENKIDDGYGRIVVDVDLSEPGEDEKALYTLPQVQELIALYQAVFRLKKVPDSHLECEILTKPPRVSGGKVKHGFHLYFRHVVMLFTDQIKLREAIQTQTDFVLDKIEKSPWFFLGCGKGGDSGIYWPTHKVNSSGTLIPLKPECDKYNRKAIYYILWPMTSGLVDTAHELGLSYRYKMFETTWILDFQPEYRPTKRLREREPVETDAHETVEDFIIAEGLDHAYKISSDRLERLEPSRCLVDESEFHDKDNAYIVVKDGYVFVGCFRGCKILNKSLRCINYQNGKRLLVEKSSPRD